MSASGLVAPARGSLIGLVLAGGESSRMGSDKALLRWRRGRTLLGQAVALLEDCGCTRVLVSGERPGFEYITDLVPGQGPLGGIHSVLEQRPDLKGWLLIIPVDMPQLQASTLRQLLAGARGGLGAVFSSGPLPMALRVTTRVRSAASGLVSNHQRALHRLVDTLQLKVVRPDCEDALVNINTVADWKSISTRRDALTVTDEP